jgi:sec-independent protein translocase protein TatA
MLKNIGFPELLLIFGVLLLLFGAKKLPELARSTGKGIQQFKSGLKETASIDDTDKTEKKD